jgi:DNA polymerase-3 subunit alpha
MVKQAYTLVESLDTLPKLRDEDVNQKLIDLAVKGMKIRGLSGNKEYEDRLKEELDLIVSKDFSIYFVVLQDALGWCRRQGILIGRGRGSSAGSLLCYVLEITDVDPIEYGLLFWRFLSEWRSDCPDIDSGIADKVRH